MDFRGGLAGQSVEFLEACFKNDLRSTPGSIPNNKTQGMSDRRASRSKSRSKSNSLNVSISTGTHLPSQYSECLLKETLDPEKEQNIIEYLQEYISRVVIENCQLRDSIDKQDCLMELLHEEIEAREEEITRIKHSQSSINDSIKLIEQHNAIYQRELRDKNTEIAELRYQLRNVSKPSRPAAMLQPVVEVSRDKSIEQLRTSQSLRKHSAKSLNLSCSPLQSMKKFISSTHKRLNIRRLSINSD